jgi:putative chitobiose transport system permease protein
MLARALNFFGESRERRARALTAYKFLLLPIAVLITFQFYPLFNTIRLSFSEFQGYGRVEYVGLYNYRALLGDRQFLTALRHTLLYSVGTVGAFIVIPFFMAILVNQKLSGMRVYRAIYYLPVVISVVIIAIAFEMVYVRDGLLNYLLRIVGLARLQTSWLADRQTALPALMVVTIWRMAGYYMMIYYAGLKAIPAELYDAAKVDGASNWQCTRYITWPCIRPFITVVAVVSLINSLKIFAEVYVMTRGGPAGATDVLNYHMYITSFDYLEMGYAAAMAVILLLVTLALSMFTMRIFERKV